MSRVFSAQTRSALNFGGNVRSHGPFGLETILVGYSQFFASTTATGGQYPTAIGRRHALAKAVLVAALAL